MNVGAHPLVVAVALGLLGPQALAEEERETRVAPSTDGPSCTVCGAPQACASSLEGDACEDDGFTTVRVEPPSDALDVAVEQVWDALRHDG